VLPLLLLELQGCNQAFELPDPLVGALQHLRPRHPPRVTLARLSGAPVCNIRIPGSCQARTLGRPPPPCASQWNHDVAPRAAERTRWARPLKSAKLSAPTSARP